MTQLTRLRIGQPFRELPGSTWNRFVDTVEKVDRWTQPNTANWKKPDLRTYVNVYNNTPAALAPGHAVAFQSLTINELDDVVVYGVTPSDASTLGYGNFGIALDAIGLAEVGRVAIAGIARTKVNVTNTSLVWCDITDGDPTKLTSHFAGRCKLIIPSALTGEQDLWVQLDSPGPEVWRGIALANITAGSSGPVDVRGDWVGTLGTVTAHLDWMHSSQDVSINKQVLIRWFGQERLWRIIAAECET